jgi:hypothetical protein
MSKLFTCITLSKEIFNRKLPDDCLYYNSVQTFNKHLTSYEVRLNCIKKITTPYYLMIDSDDPFPNTLFIPNKGILYGDNYVIDNGVETKHKSKDWAADFHVKYPLLIHKAICNTNNSKVLLKILPSRGNYYFELLMYYCLAKFYGYEYNNKFISIWNKNKNGHHSEARLSIINSIQWIENNKSFLENLKINN